MSKLWICGEFITDTPDGVVWSIEGIFDTEDKALAACTTDFHFVAPVELNEVAPEGRHIMPGSYYPLLESPPDNAA